MQKNAIFLVFSNFGEKHIIIENIAVLAKNSEIFHKNTFIHVVESQLTHKISNFDNLITLYDRFSPKLSYLQQTSYSVWHYKKYWPFSCWYDKFQVKLSLRSTVNVFWSWGVLWGLKGGGYKYVTFHPPPPIQSNFDICWAAFASPWEVRCLGIVTFQGVACLTVSYSMAVRPIEEQPCGLRGKGTQIKYATRLLRDHFHAKPNISPISAKVNVWCHMLCVWLHFQS